MIDRSRLRTVLTVILGVAFLLSLGAVVYIAVTPPPVTHPYTEFYILGPEGNASNYPTNLSVGEEGTVIVGLVNHEGESQTYTVTVVTENTSLAERRVTLAHEDGWEERVSFTLSHPGRHRVQFLLYKGSDPSTAGQPDEFLRLWVTVTA